MLYLTITAAAAATLSVGGGGYSDLQDAVDAASDGDVIQVSPGTWDGGVDLGGKDLEIISTDGAGSTTIELSGTGFFWDQGEGGRLEGFTILADGHRAFQLVDSDVEIVDVEVIGAGDGSDRGGAVSVSGGAPIFERVRFEDSRGSRGGTLYAVDGALVQLIDVEVDGGEASYGGAFFVEDASLDITGLSVRDVSVAISGGAFYLSDAALDAVDLEISDIAGEDTVGVGIYITERSAVSIEGGSFTRCAVSDLTAGYAGGGVFADDESHVTLDSVTFYENASSDGAGLALDGASGTLTDVRFEDGEGGRRGGAVYLTDSAYLTCRGCDFDQNVSADGGAVYLGSNSVFIEEEGGEWADNTASLSGGAIYAQDAYQLELAAAIFENNEAEDLGGAIYLSDLYLVASFEGVEFSSNRTLHEDGGALAADGSTELEISGALFKLNEARSGSGGAIWFDPDGGDLTVIDSSFQSNSADRDGGAIWVERGGRITVQDSELLRNTAGEGGGGLGIDGADSVECTRLLLFENTAVDRGGGYYERDADSSDFSYNLVIENVADEGGGVFFSDPPHGEVINNTFAGNTANDDGAHIYAMEGTVRLINNIFFQGVDGGGVYGDATAAAGSDIYYNDAYQNAGGDWVGDFSDPTGESGNLSEDPELRAYSSDGDETDDDLHLQLTSPCVDAGHPDLEDKDGTRSDIGAYGGLDAAVYDEDGDGAWTNTDCDDSDASVNPSASEVPYDGVDQDCADGDLVDVDGDGYTGAEAGGVDCDDEDVDINPDAAEVWYDGVDSDCDGWSDYDADQDGYDHTSFGGQDCDDADPGISPGVSENWYDGVDQDCDGWSDYDADQDGYDDAGYGGGDCNDANPLTWPGAPEIAYDGYDQDCDGEDVTDLDGDGYDGEQAGGIDCNDQDPEVYPGASDDPYDGVDSDCDGRSEYDHDADGFDAVAFGGADCDDADPNINPYAWEIWYDGVDSDCDGWNDYDADRDGFESDDYGGPGGGALDCDDTDPLTHPGSWEEWYDGIDQDCVGDDDYDQDHDGVQVFEDCDDTRPEAYPGAPELLNGLDDDCDGWAEDDDRDGDGLIDWDEWALGTDMEEPDSDGDGRLDGDEVPDVEAPPDSDLDALIDPLDSDDDGDGIPTLSEDLVDVDGDQEADQDVDGDGVPNYLDTDSDGDGYSDLDEGERDDDGDGVPDYVDFTGDFAGGGCEGGPGGAALLLLVPGLLARRRRRPDPRAARAAARICAWGALLALACPAPGALAEGLDAHGLEVLGTTGDVRAYTRLAYPYGGELGDLDAGVVVDHAAQPLTELLPDGREPVLKQLSTANLLVSGSLGPRSRLELVMPVHAVGVSAAGVFSAPGDLRLGGVIPAWSPTGARPGVALAPSVWLPTGREADYVGNPGVSGGAVVAVAQEIGAFGWAVNAGARVGRQEADRNVAAGAGPLAALGGHVLVTDALAVSAELAVQGEAGFTSFPLEATAGARWRLKRGVWTSLGGGAGLNDAPGAASWRALVGVGWSHRAPEMEVFLVADEIAPERDRDGDGLADVVDECPDQPETFDTFEDEDGCPELDGDGDGVPFERDACPEEPIYPEQDPRYSDGCPKLAELSGDKIIITQSIFFTEGSAEILPVSFEVLEAVAAIILDHPELDGVLVEGHTNNNGAAELNYELSEDRAAAVVEWMREQGVSRHRLFSKGYGFDVPLVDHDSPDAERINRRVEFTVLEIDDVPDEQRRVDPTLLPDR
jgi:predicted outer membrane repeat protein